MRHRHLFPSSINFNKPKKRSTWYRNIISRSNFKKMIFNWLDRGEYHKNHEMLQNSFRYNQRSWDFFPSFWSSYFFVVDIFSNFCKCFFILSLMLDEHIEGVLKNIGRNWNWLKLIEINLMMMEWVNGAKITLDCE